ncbi:MAG: DUF4124 domain-containing protein [Desulfosarcina sp.]
MRSMTVWIIGLAVLTATPALAQIYQYVDRNGHRRYTDDPANIPQERREAVTVMPAVQSAPNASPPADGQAPTPTRMTLPAQVAAEVADDVQRRAVQETLAQERAELQALHAAIEADRNRLGGPLPASASRSQRREYHQQALDLNLRIEDYQQRVTALREKVEAFNAQVNGSGAP